MTFRLWNPKPKKAISIDTTQAMDPVLFFTRQMFDNAIRLPELRDKALGTTWEKTSWFQVLKAHNKEFGMHQEKVLAVQWSPKKTELQILIMII